MPRRRSSWSTSRAPPPTLVRRVSRWSSSLSLSRLGPQLVEPVHPDHDVGCVADAAQHDEVIVVRRDVVARETGAQGARLIVAFEQRRTPVTARPPPLCQSANDTSIIERDGAVVLRGARQVRGNVST
jgi:hypothetical protein